MESPKSENTILVDECRQIRNMYDVQSYFIYAMMGITTTVFSILMVII